MLEKNNLEEDIVGNLSFAKASQHKEIARKHFSALALAMARNSVYHSVTPRGSSDVVKHVLRATSIDSPQPRVIVIVGAGASAAACGLPGGIDAAIHLREKCPSVQPHVIDEEILNLSLQYNIVGDDFETTLLAISKFDRQYVLKRLRDIFDRRFHPWIGYELLAHLLKHRFVDAVINFNFDEVLDQSIDDELGIGAFRKVVLDGDCPNKLSDWFDDNGPTMPLYIKPHGSASQPSSLRFTRDAYTALPGGFRSLLKELFSHKHPLQILVVGHAMQSVEFNHILMNAAKNRTIENTMAFFFLRALDKQLDAFTQPFISEGCQFEFPSLESPSHSLRLDLALLEIWKMAAMQFTNGIPPRGISRHQLVSEIFKSRAIADWRASGTEVDSDDKPKRLFRYSRDRTLVEIALAVAKAKGFATLSDLASSRAGKYFSLHRGFAGDKPAFKSLKDACEQLGLHTQGYGGRIVNLHSSRREASQKVIVSRNSFEDIAKKLAENVLRYLDLDFKSKNIARQQFVDAFLEMYEGDEVEVSVDSKFDPTLLFENAEILPSLAALKLRTRHLMLDKSTDWDALVCSAKSGEWLLNDEYVRAVKRKRARVALVLADLTYAHALRKTYGNLLEPIRSLPWWSHNQHVTLFIHERHPQFAISFERRMRATSIFPVYLSASADVHAVWNSFVAYWLKARRHNQREFDEEISELMLRAEREKLVDQLARPFRGRTSIRQ